ncbi:hypothetical protein BKA60DRAFT_547426 [Fusarium oxysporum]|nr:hypothetical protein BKA60DRAFT_547426 [Fusarium oxysporum]
MSSLGCVDLERAVGHKYLFQYCSRHSPLPISSRARNKNARNAFEIILQSGKSIHKFLQPLSVIHKAKAMQLLTANDDLAQLTGGRPLDDISKMPSDDRRAVLYDILGDWEDCCCGRNARCATSRSRWKGRTMPQLQKFTIEWYTPPKNVDDGLPYDWSTLSSRNSSKGTSLHSVTDDDGTYQNGGSNETLRWETSDDDIWSLDEDVRG